MSAGVGEMPPNCKNWSKFLLQFLSKCSIFSMKFALFGQFELAELTRRIALNLTERLVEVGLRAEPTPSPTLRTDAPGSAQQHVFRGRHPVLAQVATKPLAHPGVEQLGELVCAQPNSWARDGKLKSASR